LHNVKILKAIIYAMAEAGVQIFVATAAALGITIALLFGERAYRYHRLEQKKPAGTYGFTYESAKKDSAAA
jgi:hypothetical protein